MHVKQDMVKGTQSGLGPGRPGHYFTHFKKRLTEPEIKVHLEFHFNLRCVLLDFQSLNERKPVFECDFAYPMTLSREEIRFG